MVLWMLIFAGVEVLEFAGWAALAAGSVGALRGKGVLLTKTIERNLEISVLDTFYCNSGLVCVRLRIACLCISEQGTGCGTDTREQSMTTPPPGRSKERMMCKRLMLVTLL